MYRIVVLALVLFSTPLQAEGEARHILASAALTTMLYVTMSRLTGNEPKGKLPSLIGAAGFALATGLALEAVQSMSRNSSTIDAGDMVSNAVGVAAATGLIIAIDF